jgi:hypothetical protein
MQTARKREKMFMLAKYEIEKIASFFYPKILKSVFFFVVLPRI